MGSMSPMMEEKMVMANMMVTPADSKVLKCGFVTLCDNQNPDVMMYPGEPTISGKSLITRHETLETLTQ